LSYVPGLSGLGPDLTIDSSGLDPRTNKIYLRGGTPD